MSVVIFRFFLVTGFIATVKSLELLDFFVGLDNARIAFMDKVKKVEWANLPQMDNVKHVIQGQIDKVKDSVHEELKMADILLIHKDPAKTTGSHPILPAALVDENYVKSVFGGGWAQFTKWASLLTSDYKPIYQADQLFLNQHYKTNKDTILILHDSCKTAKDNSILKVVEALKLRNFDVNYNIMLLDFEKLMCETLSPKTAFFKIGINPQLEVLSDEIGEVFLKGIKKKKIRAEQINLLGFGVSSYLAAMVAKKIKNSSNQKLNSILGLDPPFSMQNSAIDKDSAKYIHIYHTFKLIPHTEPDVGHGTADFVFKGASRNPNCMPGDSGCFTEFGMDLFVATLLYPELFPCIQCATYSKFTSHLCDSKEYAYVSFPPDKRANGTCQLDINYEFPFGKGLEGIHRSEEETDSDSEEESSEDDTPVPEEDIRRAEVEVERVKSEIESCLQRSLAPAATKTCVMAVEPDVRRLVKQKMIKKISCDSLDTSVTGKTCSYETRDHNKIVLPF